MKSRIVILLLASCFSASAWLSPKQCEASSKYDRLIKSASDRNFGLQSDWVWHKARIRVESNFKGDAKSVVGAVGLAQFMPETALAYGADSLADRLDPIWSINAMVRYIKDIWNLFEGAGTVDRQMLSDAGYNCGQGRVLGITKKVGLTWEKVTPRLPKETQTYSPLIQKWRKVYGGVL